MKEILTVSNKDYIIQFYEQSQRDTNGKYKFVDERTSITEKENKVHAISFFHETDEGVLLMYPLSQMKLLRWLLKYKK